MDLNVDDLKEKFDNYLKNKTQDEIINDLKETNSLQFISSIISNVYIVFENDWNDLEIKGLYSTKEKALKRKNELKENCHSNKYFSIKEFTLDLDI